MTKFSQIFLSLLLIMALLMILLKNHFVKTVDWTFTFDNTQKKFNIEEIAVVGDFSKWQKWYYLRPANKNIWQIKIPLTIGWHNYRFLVNNKIWLKDPAVSKIAGPYSNSTIFVDTVKIPSLTGINPRSGSWLYQPLDTMRITFNWPVSKLIKNFNIKINLDSVPAKFSYHNNEIVFPLPFLTEGEHHCAIQLFKKGNGQIVFNKQHIFFVNLKNQAPIANAGYTSLAFPDQVVHLNGSLSFDPDFEPIVHYQWRQLAGQQVNLEQAVTPIATFKPTKPGHYLFRLTVYDSSGSSGNDLVDVYVLGGHKEKTTFSVHLPAKFKARKVALVGEFNGWNKTQQTLNFDSIQNVWRTQIELPPGSWEYKYVVNDSLWLPDPSNPEKVSDGWNGFNSLKLVAKNSFLEGQFAEKSDNENSNLLKIAFIPDSNASETQYYWFTDINNPVAKLSTKRNVLMFNKNWPQGNYFYYLVVQNKEHWSNPQVVLINHFDQTHWMDFRKTPEWADTAIIYEIFVRKFSKQGNLKGVIQKLAYLKSLGVNTIWLMPIYEGPTEHGYAPTSLFRIKKDYGTISDYQQLIEEAHKKGMRVIFDFVANHLSDQHRFVQAALENENSPLRKWFYWKTDGTYGYHNDWDTLVNLNFNTAWVRHYLLNAALFWLNLGVDGFRCDVAWAIPHDFWKQFRREIKKVNPQCLLINEVLPRNPAFHDFEFDMSYDTDFYGNVLDFLHKRKPLSAIPFGLEKSTKNYPPYSQALRYLENHDLPRFISLFGRNTTKMMTKLLFALPGSILIYYGQESLTSQMRPYFLQIRDQKWFDFFRKRIKLRVQSEAIKKGELKNLIIDDQNGKWVFKRVTQKDSLRVIVNFTKGYQQVKILGETTN